VEHHRGEAAKALALFKEALGLQYEMNNQAGVAECLAGIAAVLAVRGDPRHSALLLGAAEALREPVDAVQWPANRLEYNSTMEHLRQSLEPGALAAACEEGRQMTLEQAAARARRQEIL
ncbi:MAG: hypothetical protein ACM3JD_02035, partial [Rudaea sp.]